MTTPDPSDPLYAPDALAEPDERQWLDDEHYLEPVDPGAAQEMPADDPIVVDASGRMWRLRQRTSWTGALLGAGTLVLAVLVVAGLLAL